MNDKFLEDCLVLNLKKRISEEKTLNEITQIKRNMALTNLKTYKTQVKHIQKAYDMKTHEIDHVNKT